MIEPVTLILLIVGLAMLLKGSDYLIGSSAEIARYFHVSELVIGLTLVSVGTSLPELGVSAYASYLGSGGIAVGNVVGSNIANIALVLGLCIILRGYKIDETMLKRDGYIMLAVSLLFIILVIGDVSRLDGLILMVVFILYLGLLFKKGAEEKIKVSRKGKGITKEVLMLFIGILGVFLGAKFLVESAIDIASAIGVPESVIGVTLVAFGTSVPELAVSVNAIRKGHEGISIGNIIGSNIFNILWVIGVASLIGKLAVDRMLFNFNIPLMLFVAGLLLVFMRTGWKLERWEGMVFVALYAGFLIFNYR